jgi:hypothetical protein
MIPYHQPPPSAVKAVSCSPLAVLFVIHSVSVLLCYSGCCGVIVLLFCVVWFQWLLKYISAVLIYLLNEAVCAPFYCCCAVVLFAALCCHIVAVLLYCCCVAISCIDPLSLYN